ncbi:hypothetical protein Anapl_07983 [Anas platyrhynchos]|uniref:Uncharacterized protein n=1 Tax=Anas platyrhynchos TaxID=8839 RepID=R0KWX3_ANAPL|nr:hypothetical protein Anapl_07983 [Anas platyrhynchos]
MMETDFQGHHVPALRVMVCLPSAELDSQMESSKLQLPEEMSSKGFGLYEEHHYVHKLLCRADFVLNTEVVVSTACKKKGLLKRMSATSSDFSSLCRAPEDLSFTNVTPVRYCEDPLHRAAPTQMPWQQLSRPPREADQCNEKTTGI